VTLELESRPTTRTPGRLTARSSIATANVELARRTLVDLVESNPLEDAGERVLARLRRFVVRDPASVASRS
jgi:hypothetical protein